MTRVLVRSVASGVLVASFIAAVSLVMDVPHFWLVVLICFTWTTSLQVLVGTKRPRGRR